MTSIIPSPDNQIVSAASSQSLIHDLRQIIDQARGHVAATANYALTMMYWHVGERINRDVLGNERAEYGKQIVAQVARQLQKEYGSKGFDEKNIRRMMQFASLFPDFQIVAQLARQLYCCPLSVFTITTATTLTAWPTTSWSRIVPTWMNW